MKKQNHKRINSRDTYAIASENQKFIMIGLDNGLGGVGVAGDEILHVGVAQGTGDGQDAVDAVVQDEAAGVGHTATFVLIAAFVIVRQT